MASVDRRDVLREVQVLFRAGSIAGQPDLVLLRRFAAGPDEAGELAFAVLVERHGPMVLRACRSVLRDRHAAEDAFQATFLVLARKAGSLWVADSLGPWLRAVALRSAAGARTARDRRLRHERRFAERSGPATSEDARPDDLGPVVLDEVHRLPERLRAAVLLCDLEGLSQEQAAARLGLPVGTIKSRLSRARDRLRVRLARRGLAPAAGSIAAGLASDATAAVPQALKDSTLRLAAGLGSPASAAVLTLAKGVLAQMLFTRIKLGGLAMALGGLLAAPAMIAARSAGQDGTPAPAQSALVVAELPAAEPRLPAGRDVRIRISGGEEVTRASGTVVRSDTESSLVVTCADVFQVGKPGEFRPLPKSWRIDVDLFDTDADGSVKGELVDADFGRNVALVRIRPGRVLPSARLVDLPWKAEKGIELIAVGCTSEARPTSRTTNFVDPSLTGKNSSHGGYLSLFCRHATPPGWVGGGLFTPDGKFVGVCTHNDWNGSSLYADATNIDAILRRYEQLNLYKKLGDVEPKAPIDAKATNAGRPAPEPFAESAQQLLTSYANKKWATAARIRVWSQESIEIGSGTVIRSTPEFSFILTAASHFLIAGAPKPPQPAEFPRKITVDLFEMVPRNQNFHFERPAKNLPGELVVLNSSLDLALIRVRSGRTLATPPMVAPDWRPEVGMRMMTVGCTEGDDPTAWSTEVVDLGQSTKWTRTPEGFEAILCRIAPKLGRTGGGLYTQKGEFVGVCAYADREHGTGLYVSAAEVARFLEDYFQRYLNQTSGPRPIPGPVFSQPIAPGAIRPQSLQHLVDLLEQEWAAMEAEGIRDGQLVLTAEGLEPSRARLRMTLTLGRQQAAGSVATLERMLKIGSLRLAREAGAAGPMPASRAEPPRTDDEPGPQERRLRDVERKLDEVLRALKEPSRAGP